MVNPIAEGFREPVLGETLEFEVADLDEDLDDIVLSRIGVEPVEWSAIEEQYKIGTEHRGTVLSVNPYGVICALGPGVVGTIPPREMKRAAYGLQDWTDTVVSGQKLDVVVKSVKSMQHRIVLGLSEGRSPQHLEYPKLFQYPCHGVRFLAGYETATSGMGWPVLFLLDGNDSTLAPVLPRDNP